MSNTITAGNLAIVNPTDRSWVRNRYLFSFGAYGDAKCLVWANSLDDALDEAIDWLVEHAPGILCDEEVHKEYERAIAEGLDKDAAQEHATVDTTCGGNAGNYINSWEWSVVENPSRECVIGARG